MESQLLSRTICIPYLRFQEQHIEKELDHFGRDLRNSPKDSVVIDSKESLRALKVSRGHRDIWRSG